MLALVQSRKIQIRLRCRPGLLDDPMQENHPLIPIDIEENASNSIPGKFVLTSCRPLPNGLQVGIPTGQPNSTALMSSPIMRRSSWTIALSQDRTGSVPASVRKKKAGIRFSRSCLSVPRVVLIVNSAE
jgi:hypothetical protein